MIQVSLSIPENFQKSLSNGTIRLQLDVDKKDAGIIPELYKHVGGMLHAVFVTPEEAGDIADKPERKTPHQRLSQKFHALINEIAPAFDMKAAEYKQHFKQQHNVKVSTSLLDTDSLATLCNILEETKRELLL